ncbi:MAG: hypothetical protein AAGI91_14120 [Bacteroidota bacterium]
MLNPTVCLLALVLLPLSAHAQAWTQEPGRVYLKLTQGFANASERFDASGDVVPYDPALGEDADTPFRDRSRYLYGEVGLVPSLTLFGTIPYKRLFVREGLAGTETPIERQSSDLGSAMLGLRVGLADAVGWSESLNTLAVNAALTLPLGYRRNVSPTVGPGQVDAQFLLSYGRSFWPVPAYGQAAIGYRHRTSVFDLSRIIDCPDAQPDDAEEVCVTDGGAEVDYSDELLLTLEAGYTFFDRLLLQGLLDVAWSLQEPEVVEAAIGLQPEAFPQQRLVRTGLGATVTLFGETGLSVQAFTAPYARNALRAVEVFVGIETRL